MSQSIPDRSIVSELACGFLDCMYTIGNAPPAHENGLLKNWSRVCHNWIMLMSQLVLERSIPGGNFHIKSTGMLEGSFEINPYETQSSCLVSVAWNVFTPKIFHFQNIKLSTVIFFRLSATTGTGKAPAVDPARLNTVRKLPFLTPKGMVSTLFVFFMGFPLGVNFEFMVSWSQSNWRLGIRY